MERPTRMAVIKRCPSCWLRHQGECAPRVVEAPPRRSPLEDFPNRPGARWMLQDDVIGQQVPGARLDEFARLLRDVYAPGLLQRSQPPPYREARLTGITPTRQMVDEHIEAHRNYAEDDTHQQHLRALRHWEEERMRLENEPRWITWSDVERSRRRR